MQLSGLVCRRGAAVLAGALVLAGATPAGAGSNAVQNRNVAAFDRVETNGAFTTDIVAGTAKRQVAVTADVELVDRITTEVRGTTLVIGVRPGTANFDRPPTVTIALPVLRGYANYGASRTTITGLSGGDVEIENSGASVTTAQGRVARETLTLNGTGKIDATAVQAGDASVENNGVGVINVRAAGTLTMTVNGLGTIGYTGNPAHVESHVYGIGHIGRL